MRRNDRAIDDRAAQELILDAATVVRLGFVDAGRPYVVPLNFARVGGALYFHSAAAGRKVDLLRSGAEVCFEAEGDCRVVVADDACSCSAYYESVIGWGRPEFLTDPDEKRLALRAINRKYGVTDDPIEPKLLARTEVVRLAITEMTGKAHRPPADAAPADAADAAPTHGARS
jgi:nitroimidazol reductase NimA-like FMN-containing flavoprotein (pyridoxamine 5'-phosphate oxidase superfamily)